MIQPDVLQRFLFKNQPVRFEIIRLHKTYQNILKNYDYPLAVQQLLGQALAATALLSATIKFAGKLTLQIQSKGPVNFLVAQSDHEYNLRGLAKWIGEINQTEIAQTFADGYLGITIAPQKGEPYQGVVKLTGSNLSNAIETYFAQSEQLPTGICIFADSETVIGLFMQIIPGDMNEQQNEFWQNAFYKLHHLNLQNLISSTSQEIFSLLVDDDEPVEFISAQPVKFHCDCTVERMERAIQLLGQKEANEILKENKYVTVTCEFCNKQHDFSASEIDNIFLKYPKNLSEH